MFELSRNSPKIVLFISSFFFKEEKSVLSLSADETAWKALFNFLIPLATGRLFAIGACIEGCKQSWLFSALSIDRPL